eukprot:GEMP01035733.1.p1 GENE.GEMP01035733.1~~GEMP01035733.1.p1  ORF type:complete len:383 (+),score=52.84 GEMP01035733.1:137-1285(+)
MTFVHDGREHPLPHFVHDGRERPPPHYNSYLHGGSPAPYAEYDWTQHNRAYHPPPPHYNQEPYYSRGVPPTLDTGNFAASCPTNLLPDVPRVPLNPWLSMTAALLAAKRPKAESLLWFHFTDSWGRIRLPAVMRRSSPSIEPMSLSLIERPQPGPPTTCIRVAPVSMEGWLLKRGPHHGMVWRLRFCRLQGRKFTYYSREDPKTKKGEFPFDHRTRIRAFSDRTCSNEGRSLVANHPMGFEIFRGHNERCYLFDAWTHEKLMAWLQGLINHHWSGSPRPGYFPPSSSGYDASGSRTMSCSSEKSNVTGNSTRCVYSTYSVTPSVDGILTGETAGLNEAPSTRSSSRRRSDFPLRWRMPEAAGDAPEGLSHAVLRPVSMGGGS